MKLGTLLLLTSGFILCESLLSFENETEWQLFTKKHGKRYEQRNEEIDRKRIFFSNLQKIIAHNLQADLGLKSFRLSINKFADLTNDGFKAKRTGSGYKKPNLTKLKTMRKLNATRVLSSIDWRQKGVVTYAKNQGACGADWAFAAVAALESHKAIKTGKFLSLSEQNLVDCSRTENYGCDGGLVDPAFEYVRRNDGVAREASYPYEGRLEICRYSIAKKGASCKGYVDIAPNDEILLRDVVATKGPVCVRINTALRSFMFYGSGIYDDFLCGPDPNQAVVIVGYGTSKEGKDFWIIKNSWGSGWGERGFARIARNKNMCGIALTPSYPLV